MGGLGIFMHSEQRRHRVANCPFSIEMPTAVLITFESVVQLVITQRDKEDDRDGAEEGSRPLARIIRSS